MKKENYYKLWREELENRLGSWLNFEINGVRSEVFKDIRSLSGGGLKQDYNLFMWSQLPSHVYIGETGLSSAEWNRSINKLRLTYRWPSYEGAPSERHIRLNRHFFCDVAREVFDNIMDVSCYDPKSFVVSCYAPDPLGGSFPGDPTFRIVYEFIPNREFFDINYIYDDTYQRLLKNEDVQNVIFNILSCIESETKSVTIGYKTIEIRSSMITVDLSHKFFFSGYPPLSLDMMYKMAILLCNQFINSSEINSSEINFNLCIERSSFEDNPIGFDIKTRWSCDRQKQYDKQW